MDGEAGWELLIFPQCGRARPQRLTRSKSREAATAALPAAGAARAHAHARSCPRLGKMDGYPDGTPFTCACEPKTDAVWGGKQSERFDGGLFLAPTYRGVPGAVLHSGFQAPVSHFLL